MAEGVETSEPLAQWEAHLLLEQEVATLRLEVARLKALVGEEGQPGWSGVTRAGAIRQAEDADDASRRWRNEFERMRDQAADCSEELRGERRLRRDLLARLAALGKEFEVERDE